MLQAGTVIHQPPYYILQQVVSSEICELLADYALFKAKIKPNVTKNIDPLDNVHREYGDPLLELLLEKLTPKIEQTLGCAVWPTLSFYYVYHQGTSLKAHSDRSSCQWVASLCIGADPEFKNRGKSWPLILKNDNQHDAQLSKNTYFPRLVRGIQRENKCLDSADKPRNVGVTEIHLQCGDILLFKGHETEHWRDQFTGQWFVSAIFAFVEQEGPYAFQKYDQRSALGKPHIGMFRWSFGCLKQKLLKMALFNK